MRTQLDKTRTKTMPYDGSRMKNTTHPSVTARVKISQNVDIFAKEYPVHLKVKHCQTSRVVSTFTGQNESTVFYR